MKASITRISAVAVLIVSFLLWMYGGARMGFYAMYHEIILTDEITGLTYPERVDGFLPGVETLVLGFAAFVTLLLASLYFERRTAES